MLDLDYDMDKIVDTVSDIKNSKAWNGILLLSAVLTAGIAIFNIVNYTKQLREKEQSEGVQ